MHPLQKKFGEVLRRLREARGLSQEKLAEQASLHRNSVGLMERGQRMPTILVVQQLAEALGTSMSALLAEVEKQPDAPWCRRNRRVRAAPTSPAEAASPGSTASVPGRRRRAPVRLAPGGRLELRVRPRRADRGAVVG